MFTKNCVGFFLFYLELELFVQIKKRSVFCTLTKTKFVNNSRSKQNKKNSEHPFVDIGKTETRAKIQQKYSAIWKLELVKVFNFSNK